jgi:hypothetical protein
MAELRDESLVTMIEKAGIPDGNFIPRQTHWSI